jgi:hypothetical protein
MLIKKCNFFDEVGGQDPSSPLSAAPGGTSKIYSVSSSHNYLQKA